MSLYAALEVPPPLTRTPTYILPPDPKTPSFIIDHTKKSYKHQYSNIYFIRLRLLKQAVQARAARRWGSIAGNPVLVPRALEVEKGRLCYVIGTVYMDMPLKPNVMEDIARDQSIPPPPQPTKFYSAYDNVMLEDESGRIKLVGDRVKDALLVTGVIIGALGVENQNGEFEVVDLCYPEMTPQYMTEEEEKLEKDKTNKMDVDDEESSNKPSDEWIGVISGLDVGSASPADAQIQMLVEYLTGEEGCQEDQVSASQISRLIIAGDSLAPVTPVMVAEGFLTPAERKAQKHGYDTVAFSPRPIIELSSSLDDLASSIPINILPGNTDPSGTIIPQQPFPRAMFGDASRYSTFNCESNPTYLNIGSTDPGASSSSSSKQPKASTTTSSVPEIKRKLLINSGQPINDIFRYLPSPPNTRLAVLEATLRWRHQAPTAPDTLWCHPYFAEDPFIITETPDIYIVGGQRKFGTKLVVDDRPVAIPPAQAQQVKGKAKGGKAPDQVQGVVEERTMRAKTKCRIVLVPSFAHTGKLVLINLRTLDVKCVNFLVHGMASGGKDENGDDAETPVPAEPQLTAPMSSMDYEFGDESD